MGPPREKGGGVIRHILERENGNWMEKLCYCVNNQSGIQHDWVTWRENEFQAISGRDLCEKLA